MIRTTLDFLEAFIFRWRLRTHYVGDKTTFSKAARCFSFAANVVRDNRWRDAHKYPRVRW